MTSEMTGGPSKVYKHLKLQYSHASAVYILGDVR